MPKKGVPDTCPTCKECLIAKQERATKGDYVLVTYACGHTLKSRSKIALRRFSSKE
jgi:hypothetical protein